VRGQIEAGHAQAAARELDGERKPDVAKAQGSESRVAGPELVFQTLGQIAQIALHADHASKIKRRMLSSAAARGTRDAPMKAVILAGGEGTRLRPLTLAVPKPVVPVVDRPFLRHQLGLLSRVGVQEIVFSVAYQPERVQAVFGDGAAFGRRIHYAVEETPLGTGGAVKNAESHLDDTTVGFNGGVLTDVDIHALLAAHAQSG